jgi:hypothetical protein
VDIFAQLPNLAGVGLGGTLVFVILYLLRSNYNDRSQHRDMVASVEASHKDDLKSRDDRISSLRKEIADLESEVDRERDLRRQAEDRAAIAERAALVNEARTSALQMLAEGRSNAHSPTVRVEAIEPAPPPIEGRTHRGGS